MIHSEGISVSSEIKQNWWGGWSCWDLFASWLGACCMWRLVFFLSHLMLWRNAAVHFALNYKSGTYAFFWFVTWCLSCKPLHGHVMVYNAIKVPTITFVICFHRIQLYGLWYFYHVKLWGCWFYLYISNYDNEDRLHALFYSSRIEVNQKFEHFSNIFSQFILLSHKTSVPSLIANTQVINA